MNSDVARPRAATTAGGLAGFALFLVDWIATGIARTPWTLALLSLAAFLAGGLAAGLAARLARAPGAAASLALAGALLLHALSVVSKELAAAGTFERGVGFAFALVLALPFGALSGAALRRARPGSRPAWLVVLAASVPGAALGHWALADAPRAVEIASPALALLVPAAAAVAAPRLRPGAARALAVAALAALALPVALFDREPPRRFVPEPARATALPGSPSVVLLLVDTLRADLALAPGAERGALAMLARDGVRFTEAVSSAPWTLPATSSILTSLYPSQHGAVMVTTSLSDDVLTLAEVFHASGYETAAFTGGGFISPAFGLDQGFELFDPQAEFRFRPFRVHVPLFWRAAKNRYLPLRPLLALVYEFGGLQRTRGEVERWLAERDPARPFFLLVHTYQVHDYYIYHPEPDDALRSAGERVSATFAGRLSVHPSEIARASQRDLDWFRELYRNRIRFVDDELGRLLGSVRRHVEPQGLVIALTSDHGEGFEARRVRVLHGDRLHDDLLRVPLVLSAPGHIPPGRVVDAQVRTVDLMPTLIELAGLELPAGLAGRSLLPCLAGTEPWPELAFGEVQKDALEQRAVRTAEWKLIEGTQGRESYDLGHDPEESAPQAGVPGRLAEELGLFERHYPSKPGDSTALDAATRQHLRDLGYID